MKLRISVKEAAFTQDLDGDMDEAVFTKDLDGDGNAEVPDGRDGETLPPDMAPGQDDKNNDGKTDSSREPSPEKGDADPMDDKPEEVPGDDELADIFAELEEQVYNLVKKII